MQHTIKDILDSAFNADVVLNIPKDSTLGHFATPIAFSLAKMLKKSPNEIAQNLAKNLADSPQFSQYFSKIEAVNGFVNLALSDSFLAQMSKSLLENDGFHASKSQNQQKILLEFVSANPTGPLHIGHARGAIYGDTLARIGRFLGHKITSEYYINDAGSQIDNLVNSVLNAKSATLGDSSEMPQDSTHREFAPQDSTQNLYKGEYVITLADEAMEHFGSDFAKTPQLRDFCVNKMLSLIKDNLKNANIAFDNFVSEKSLIAALPSTLEALKSNDGLYEKDGKVWLKSSLFGDEKDRVIIRESGEPTYLAGDIVYHNDKFKRDFDSYINIWGADHHGYIARIKASVAFLGFDNTKLECLLSQMVTLLKDGKPYKMSKRAGNFILMSEVIDEIGIDALRFIFITKRADTHLEFDITDLKKQDSSNPIFYINYANARIHTLLEKSTAEISFDFTNLGSEWKDLLFFAMLLPSVLEASFSERAMQKLPEYLKNLASKLHFCYNTYKIIGSSSEGAICCVLKVVSLSITTGLNLMGIVAKTKM